MFPSVVVRRQHLSVSQLMDHKTLMTSAISEASKPPNGFESYGEETLVPQPWAHTRVTVR